MLIERLRCDLCIYREMEEGKGGQYITLSHPYIFCIHHHKRAENAAITLHHIYCHWRRVNKQINLTFRASEHCHLISIRDFVKDAYPREFRM